MSELEDEVLSINSIYGEKTILVVSKEPTIYALSLPAAPSVSLRIEFPLDYPDAPPSILGTQSVGDLVRGEGEYVVGLVRETLGNIYSPGAPVVFDLIEEADIKLQAFDEKQQPERSEQHAPEADGQQDASSLKDNTNSDNLRPFDELTAPPPWTLSEVMKEKKSVFVARAAPVTSVDQAKSALSHLLSTDKKVAKATHNITAWRIRGENGVQYQDCDDDGETAAGGRLLHLMTLIDVWDVMVVVTRWYGGVQLGPDRFRIINSTARDALIRAGFAQQGSRDAKTDSTAKQKRQEMKAAP